MVRCAITFSDPVQITIMDDDVVPRAGVSHTLTCNVTAVVNVTTYKWRKNNTTLPGEQDQLLTFPSLSLSNAGHYTCEVAVASKTYVSEVKPIYLQGKCLGIYIMHG